MDKDLEECASGDEDMYQAWHIGGQRVMVKMPSEAAAEKAAEAGTQMVDYNTRKPRMQEAYDVARNDMLTDPDRHFKYFLLEFPFIPSDEDAIDRGLDNSILSPGAQDGKIAPDFIPLLYSSEVDPHQFENGRANIIWDICITETKPRLTTKTTKKNQLADKITEKMGGASM